MGEKKKRLQRFFANHPNCCFCAGERLATTEDHQPGRVFFRGREWPEGFSFPACEQCNAVSRESERVLAVLIHGHADDADRSKYQTNLRSVYRDYPEEIGALVTTTREKRNILKTKGLARPHGVALDDLPIVKMNKAFWEPHFEMLARKLLLALHYQCFGQPLSRQGALWYYIHTNADFAAGEFPEEVLEIANRIATPVRNKQALHKQFLVRWNVVEDRSGGLFLAQLQRMLTITGITTENLSAFERDRPKAVLRPFGPWLIVNLSPSKSRNVGRVSQRGLGITVTSALIG
jgi:hypothetical protein